MLVEIDDDGNEGEDDDGMDIVNGSGLGMER